MSLLRGSAGSGAGRVNRGAPAERYTVMDGAKQLHDEPDLVAEHAVELRAVESFETFYARELPGLVMLARALSGSSYADDIAQESMLAAYKRWNDVSAYESPTAWVRQVCANKAVSVVRRRMVEARALMRLGARREEPAALAEDSEAFWDAVRRLPRRQAQCVALYYVYDIGVVEVAQILGCSAGSVKVHLSRARTAMAGRLGETTEEQA